MAKTAVMPMPPVVNGSTSQVHGKVLAVMQDMQNVLLERDEHIEVATLCLLASQNGFLLGPPGTAKSLQIELLCKSIQGAEYFRTLAGRLSPPEQFFGPIKVSGLKNDRYERKIDGYAPTAHVAFFDEIYKAGSGVLNSLLTLFAEHLFQQDDKMVQTPLISAFAASNELPENKAELAALHDRFPVRLYVDRLQEMANRVKLLTERRPKMKATILLQELKQAQDEVAGVEVPQVVAATMREIQDEVAGNGIESSDRRMQAAMELVRAHAWLKGRSKATIADLAVLRHVFWDEPNHIQLVANIVLGKVNPLERKARDIYESVLQAVKSIEKIDDEAAAFAEAKKHIIEFNKELDQLSELAKEAEAGGYDPAPVFEYERKATELHNDLFEKYTGGLRRRKVPRRANLGESVKEAD